MKKIVKLLVAASLSVAVMSSFGSMCYIKCYAPQTHPQRGDIHFVPGKGYLKGFIEVAGYYRPNGTCVPVRSSSRGFLNNNWYYNRLCNNHFNCTYRDCFAGE